MARIGCNVLNCSHNDSGVCYANRISITGKKAHTSNHRKSVKKHIGNRICWL